jgi:Zn-dependent peptidase ImmA (M78 family)
VNWQVANATAMMRAVQVHRDLGIDRTGYVDVFAALKDAGIECMAKPLARLFGFYYAPRDGGPAALLNADLDEITLRHTAAHELGHHAFDHGSRADTDLDLAETLPGRAWTTEEMQAESFAAWFLMPPPAVQAAMRRMGVNRVDGPEQVYELARWLGASYAGTVRHLLRLKTISRQTAEKWARAVPGRIRARLYGAPTPRPLSHVFTLRPEAHGSVLHVSAGDVISPRFSGSVEQLPSGLRFPAPAKGAPDNNGAEAAGLSGRREVSPLAVEVTDRFTTAAVLRLLVPGHEEPFVVTLVPAARRFGIDKVWGAQQAPETVRPDKDDQ